ncbi:glutathione S-transferase 4-like [Rhipicephalus sanguineus]|uniref:glutathione S-transferase 4-like n=1 Tax=Rhipicephalus sanguineus TaxID=34632 RepID=UPI001896311D|nr:glutathione S-transferase 4-like [Rhipicephalus sanguineus]
MTITLYMAIASPPCNFVRSVAKHAGIELTLKKVDMANKEHLRDEYLKINPFHKVPAMDDDGFVVYESNAIAYHLLRKYAPESQLYPACIKTRTRIDQILSSISTTLHTAAIAFLFPRFIQKTKPTAEELADFEQNFVSGLEHLIGDGKFAASDAFTLADIALTTRIVVALENGYVDPAKFPKLASYYDRVKREQPHFEEICMPGANNLKEAFAKLK